MAGDAHSFVELYGRRGGRPAIYLHGVPGSPAEAELIDEAARISGVELWALDRARVATSFAGDSYLSGLTDLVHRLGTDQRLPMIGFSIGAAFALRIASRLGNEVGPLFLLSTAGPLDMPGAFDGMGAGARVFQLAQKGSAAFTSVVRLQAILARRAPDVLRRLLFAGTDGADRRFAAESVARKLLPAVLAQAFTNRGASYRRDILTYVADWSIELTHVRAPVQMWHGSADTWAPLTMAQGVASRLPSPPRLHVGETGHYTTLTGSARVMLDAARDATG